MGTAEKIKKFKIKEMRETILILAVIISFFLIWVAIPKINKLYNTNKISSSTKALLIYISVITPIIGLIAVEITDYKIRRKLSH